MHIENVYGYTVVDNYQTTRSISQRLTIRSSQYQKLSSKGNACADLTSLYRCAYNLVNPIKKEPPSPARLDGSWFLVIGVTKNASY